jgi:translation elongation factor EF-G
MHRNTNKKNNHKNRRTSRKTIRGGANNLGRIFLELVENKRIFDKEALDENNHAQTRAYQTAGENMDDLMEELHKNTNLTKDEIKELMNEYMYKDDSMKIEKRAHKESGSSGQGEHISFDIYLEFIDKLDTEHGINVFKFRESSKKRKRSASRSRSRSKSSSR